jgi:hypothetical protein
MKQAASIAFAVAAFAIGLAFAPAVSQAQPSPSYTPVPMARPDFSSMMFATGAWNCTQMLRGSKRPDSSNTMVGMDGAWMVTQDVAPPFDKFRTYTINGTTYTTYDPTVKQWVQISVDTGGGYGLSSSPGWQGNALTWTTKGLDGSTSTDVWTKVSDTQTTDDITTTDAQGTATKVHIDCTKAADAPPVPAPPPPPPLPPPAR